MKKVVTGIALLCCILSLVGEPLVQTRAADTAINISTYNAGSQTAPDHTCNWQAKFDNQNHWQECTICHATKSKAAHTLVGNGGDKNLSSNYYNDTYRNVCACGFQSKPFLLILGRPVNYVESMYAWYTGSLGDLSNVMQITQAEFLAGSWSHAGCDGQQNEGTVPGIIVEKDGYTWWDHDSDGYGWVFCGGPVASYSLGTKGTIALCTGSEGDFESTFTGNINLKCQIELYALGYYCKGRPGWAGDTTPTRAEYVAWLPAKSTISQDHMLYGLKEKYQRVTDAQFNKIIPYVQKFTPAVAGYGRNSMASSYAGQAYCYFKYLCLCYDSAKKVSLSGSNKIGGTCDLCGKVWTGLEAWDHQWITYPNVANPRVANGATLTHTGTVTFPDGTPIFEETLYMKNVNGVVTAYAVLTAKPGVTFKVGGVSVSSPYTTPTATVPLVSRTGAAYNMCTIVGVQVTKGTDTQLNYIRAFCPYVDLVEPAAYSYPGAAGSNNYWKVVGNGSAAAPSVSARLTATFSDAKTYAQNQLYIRVFDSDQNTLIPFASGATAMPLVNINGTEDVWQGTFDIKTETTSTKNIYVQAYDAMGNYSTKVPMAIKYLDAKAPVLAIRENATEWTKSRTLTMQATDSSKVAYLGISKSDMQNVIPSGATTGTRTYNITGDVYASKNVTFYAKDAAGNLSYTEVAVTRIDNTAPTVTDVSSVLNTLTSTVTITANDVNAALGAAGSGVTKYALTKSATKPAASSTEWKTSNVFTVKDNGIYYAWAMDAVGNISNSYRVTVFSAIGVRAELNSTFTSAYSSICKDGSYDIDTPFTITPAMLNVYVQKADDTEVKTTAFTLVDATIDELGSNLVTVRLNETEYTTTVKIIGYSKALSASMEDLGIPEGDFATLAAKMRATIERLETLVNNTSSTLAEVWNITGIVGTFDHTDTEDLNKIITTVRALRAEMEAYRGQLQGSVTTINSMSVKLDGTAGYSDILTQVTTLSQINMSLEVLQDEIIQVNNDLQAYVQNSLGNESDDTGDLHDLMGNIQNNITEMERRTTELLGFASDLRELLGLDVDATLTEIYDTVSDIKTRMEYAEDQIEKSKADIGTMTNVLGASVNDKIHQMEKINTIKSSLEGLQSELMLVDSELIEYMDNYLGNEVTEAGNLHIVVANIQNNITEMERRTTELLGFAADLRNLLNLDDEAALDVIYDKVFEIKGRMEYAEGELYLSKDNIDKMADALGDDISGEVDQSQKVRILTESLLQLKADLSMVSTDFQCYISDNLGGEIPGHGNMHEIAEIIKSNITVVEQRTTELLTFADTMRTLLGYESDSAPLGDIIAKVDDIQERMQYAEEQIDSAEPDITEMAEYLGIDLTTNPDLSNKIDIIEDYLRELQIVLKENNEALAKYIKDNLDGEITDDSTLYITSQTMQANIKTLEERASKLLEFSEQLKQALGLEADVTLGDITSSIFDLKSDLVQAKDDITEYEEAIAEVKAALNLPNLSSGEQDELQTVLANLILESKALADKIANAEKVLKENLSLGDVSLANAEAIGQEIAGLKLNLASSSRDVNRLNEKVTQQIEENVTLQGEKAKLDKEVTTLLADLELARSSVAALTVDKEKLTETNSDLSEQLQQAKDSNASLTSEKRSLERDLASARGEVEAISSMLGADPSEIEVKYIELTRTVEVVKTEVVELQSDISEKEGTIADLTQQSLELARLKDDLSWENGDLKSRLENLSWYKDWYDKGGETDGPSNRPPDLEDVDDPEIEFDSEGNPIIKEVVKNLYQDVRVKDPQEVIRYVEVPVEGQTDYAQGDSSSSSTPTGTDTNPSTTEAPKNQVTDPNVNPTNPDTDVHSPIYRSGEDTISYEAAQFFTEYIEKHADDIADAIAEILEKYKIVYPGLADEIADRILNGDLSPFVSDLADELESTEEDKGVTLPLAIGIAVGCLLLGVGVCLLTLRIRRII